MIRCLCVCKQDIWKETCLAARPFMKYQVCIMFLSISLHPENLKVATYVYYIRDE